MQYGHARIVVTLCVLLSTQEALSAQNASQPASGVSKDAEQTADKGQGLWSIEKARKWHNATGPIRGFNYLPRSAVNTTEMWQADTFDPKTIDEELGWAENAGYNAARVFLQSAVWAHDSDGLKKRIDQFLKLADRHGIRVMFVLFDDCAFDSGREPYLGRQDDPIPGVHNSRWVPSPGRRKVLDRSSWPQLQRYVQDLIGTFGKDRRVQVWDLYNEPGNGGMEEKSLPLLEAAFRWAREAKPDQPLTAGPWIDAGGFDAPLSRRMLELSDVLSFHSYDPPAGIRAKIEKCRKYDRPMLCTEWLHRQSGNTFASVLPVFREEQIGWYHWGLVAGRTQTFLHWGSQKGSPTPAMWQHDVFHPKGKPYDPAEFVLLKAFRYSADAR